MPGPGDLKADLLMEAAKAFRADMALQQWRVANVMTSFKKLQG